MATPVSDAAAATVSSEDSATAMVTAPAPSPTDGECNEPRPSDCQLGVTGTPPPVIDCYVVCGFDTDGGRCFVSGSCAASPASGSQCHGLRQQEGRPLRHLLRWTRLRQAKEQVQVADRSSVKPTRLGQGQASTRGKGGGRGRQGTGVPCGKAEGQE